MTFRIASGLSFSCEYGNVGPVSSRHVGHDPIAWAKSHTGTPESCVIVRKPTQSADFYSDNGAKPCGYDPLWTHRLNQ